MQTGQIEGRTFTLQELFERSSYDIDYYQREYAWSTREVRTLVDDLCTQFDEARSGHRRIRDWEPFFLGPFVYYEQSRRTRFLVDGQQRFTTIHLIFLHLHRQAVSVDERSAIAKLDRVIRFHDGSGWRFRIDIAERTHALDALLEGKGFEPPLAASLSLRNLCARSAELRQLLDVRLDAEDLPHFVDWLLTRVLLVGIQAPSRDSGFRIFESMNDRGARLSTVDLVKSYLLSHAGQDEERLNVRWREMLAELSPLREDTMAPARFLKAAMIAHHARLGPDESDVAQIDAGLHLWVRQNAESQLGLRSAGRYHQFVDQLIRLATLYRTVQAAAIRYESQHGLGAVYFNEQNGLGNQMAFILAAIRPDDTLSAAKEKAALVSNVIDRWFVLRTLADEPALARDLEAQMPDLLPALRECRSIEQVREVLQLRLDDDAGFEAIRHYWLRGNNTAQVRYLLARLTAFAQRGWDEPDLVAEYLAKERLWQIEHIFPNRPERHPEVSEPGEFRRLRNRLGLLVLLRASVNQSLQDMAVERKTEVVYRGENLLVRCLHPTFRSNNKPIREFAKRYGLEAHLRPLGGTPPSLPQAVVLRQELYRLLAIAIWGRAALGFTPSAGPPPSASPAAIPQQSAIQGTRRVTPRPTDVQRMVRSGLLASGTVVVGIEKGHEYTATIDVDGSFVLPTGERIRRADDAVRAVIERGRVGMQFWHVVSADGQRKSLAELRAALRTLP